MQNLFNAAPRLAACSKPFTANRPNLSLRQIQRCSAKTAEMKDDVIGEVVTPSFVNKPWVRLDINVLDLDRCFLGKICRGVRYFVDRVEVHNCPDRVFAFFAFLQLRWLVRIHCLGHLLGAETTLPDRHSTDLREDPIEAVSTVLWILRRHLSHYDGNESISVGALYPSCSLLRECVELVVSGAENQWTCCATL